MRFLALMGLASLLLLLACSDNELTGSSTAQISTLTITIQSENGSMLYGASIYINGEYKGKISEFGETAGTKTVVLQGSNNQIAVTREGYADGTATVSASYEGQQQVTITLSQLKVALSVQVQDREGAITDARIALYENETLVDSAFSNSEGIATFKEVADATYTLRISKRGYQSFSVDQAVNYAEEPELKLSAHLLKLPILEVVVRSDDSSVLEGAEVTLYDKEVYYQPDAYPFGTKFTNDEGRVTFNQVEYEEEYVVIIKKAGYTTEMQQLRLEPEKQELKFTLKVLE